LILLENSLQKFLISKEEIENLNKGVLGHNKSLSDLLNEKRNEFFKIQYEFEGNTKYIKQSKMKHTMAEEFLKSLKANNTIAIKDFLIKQNKCAVSDSYSKTICLVQRTLVQQCIAWHITSDSSSTM